MTMDLPEDFRWWRRRRPAGIGGMQEALDCALRVLWASESVARARDRHGWPRDIPKLTVRAKRTGGANGKVWVYQHRILLSVNPEVSFAWALEILAHEVAHFHRDPPTRTGRRRSHGPTFRAELALLLAEVYGLDLAELQRINRTTRRTYQADHYFGRLVDAQLVEILARVGIRPPR